MAWPQQLSPMSVNLPLHGRPAFEGSSEILEVFVLSSAKPWGPVVLGAICQFPLLGLIVKEPLEGKAVILNVIA